MHAGAKASRLLELFQNSEQKQAPGANDLCVCMCVVVWWDGSRERLLSAQL